MVSKKSYDHNRALRDVAGLRGILAALKHYASITTAVITNLTASNLTVTVQITAPDGSVWSTTQLAVATKVTTPTLNTDSMNGHTGTSVTTNADIDFSSTYGAYNDSAWTSITSFSNGWSSGGNCRYKRAAQKNAVWLQLYASAGTLTNGTTIATITDSTYWPSSNQFIEIGTAGGSASVNDAFIRIDTSGAITIWYSPNGIASIRANDFYARD